MPDLRLVGWEVRVAMTRTCFPYPGGKSQYAAWIVSSLPAHSCYVEAFGGSGAVFFNKEPSQIEVYNDLDGDIPHFFRVLRDDGEDLQEYLRQVEFSKDLYEQWTRRWYEGWRPSDDVKRAAVFYFSRYAQWGGKYEGISGFARSASGRDKAKTWRKKVEDLEDFQERLNDQAPGEWPPDFVDFKDRARGVLIDNLDYRELFEKYDADNSDGEGTFFYCDPPYVDTEHRYSGDGFDHEAFIDALLDLEGDWLVSYGTEVPERLQSFRTESEEATRGIDRVSSNGKAAHERLIKSYPKHRERSFEIGGTSGNALDKNWGEEDED